MTSGYEQRYRQRPSARPIEFLRARTRPAKFDDEHTRLSCIYAHYRKWAFFADFRPVDEKSFEKELAKVCQVASYDLYGQRMYAWFVLDPPAKVQEEPEEAREPSLPKVLGQVRVVRKLDFLSETCEPGIVVDWVEPTPWEKQNLERLNKGVGSATVRGHLVINWNGKRRCISGNSVERVL